MPPKSDAQYNFDGDWTSALKKVKVPKGSGLTLTQMKNTFSYTYKMAGERKMSPRQRSILDKMNHAKSNYLMNETVKTINKLILNREKDVQDIADAARKKNTPLTKAASDKVDDIYDNTSKDIAEIITDANAEFEKASEKHLQQFVKGKHHKKKKTVQIVKHAVKTPVSIALAPVALAGLMSGVGAPIGLVALKGSLGNLKSTVDYCRRHKAGIAGLVKRIEKNAKIILPILGQYEDLAKKAAAGDPAAKKDLKIFKHKVNKVEIEGYAWETFTNQHSKTISHLADLVDKYRRAVNKYKYSTIQIGRKMDKVEDEIAGVKKAINKRIAGFPKLKADLKAAGYDPQFIKIEIENITKQNWKGILKINELDRKMKALDGQIDMEVKVAIQHEIMFEEWAKNVEDLKSMRPKAVSTAKKWIKGAAFFGSVAELGLGGTSDVVGGIETGVDTGVAMVSYAQDGFDLGKDAFDTLKDRVSK